MSFFYEKYVADDFKEKVINETREIRESRWLSYMLSDLAIDGTLSSSRIVDQETENFMMRITSDLAQWEFDRYLLKYGDSYYLFSIHIYCYAKDGVSLLRFYKETPYKNREQAVSLFNYIKNYFIFAETSDINWGGVFVYILPENSIDETIDNKLKLSFELDELLQDINPFS